MGMTVEEYRKRMMDAFHNTDCDELIALVALPTEKEFKHLEWLLKTHYKTPKDQYEARLKADMVVILEELQTKIQKYSGCSCMCSDGIVNDIDDLIQEKIDKLKENNTREKTNNH